MLHALDRWVFLGFLTFMLLLTAVYIRRVRLRGHMGYERIDAVGSGAVVGQSVFEMGYWWMQPVARGFVRAGFSANGVTWLSALMWAACAVLTGFGLLGFACMAGSVAAFCDTLDGLVARLRQTSSQAGEILDGTVDRYGDVLVFGALAVFYSGLVPMQILSLAALAGAMGVSHASSKAEELGIAISKGFMRRPERCVTLLVTMGLSALTIPAWETSLHWSHPVGVPLAGGLVLIAVIANVSAVTRLRELAAAVRARA